MQVKGLQEAIDKLVEFHDNAFRDAVEEIQKVGEEIVDEARQDAPVRTGKLQSSIQSEATADGCKISSDVPYAGYVNRKHPFMTNALMDVQTRIVDRIKERLEE